MVEKIKLICTALNEMDTILTIYWRAINFSIVWRENKFHFMSTYVVCILAWYGGSSSPSVNQQVILALINWKKDLYELLWRERHIELIFWDGVCQ